jgi:hypothetical protein
MNKDEEHIEGAETKTMVETEDKSDEDKDESDNRHKHLSGIGGETLANGRRRSPPAASSQ